jgi:hypothetical protein
MLLTAAVSKGIHSIDVSLIINPVVHEYIVSLAEDAGVNFIESFSNTKERDQDIEKKAVMLLKQSLSKTPKNKQDAGYSLLKEAATTGAQEMPNPQENTQQEPAIQPEQPKGFMQRKVK